MSIQLFTDKPTKSAVSAAADMHVTSVLSEGDIHRAWLEAKWYEELATAIMDRLKEHVIGAPEPDAMRMGGAKIVVNQRREYGYNHDSKWLTLKEAETQASEARKAHEKLMLSLPSEFADTTTGEVTQPAKLLGVKSVITTTLPK